MGSTDSMVRYESWAFSDARLRRFISFCSEELADLDIKDRMMNLPKEQMRLIVDGAPALEEMFAEFLKIYKFLYRPQIIEALTTELSDQTRLLVYELSDGQNTSRNIGQKAKISFKTVTVYWKQWAAKGIVVPAQRKGRFKAAFGLSEYGLSVVDVEEQEE